MIRELLPVPLVGEEDHQLAKVPRSMVVNIIRPRLEETFEYIKDRLDSAGLARAAGNRVVLTGGACQLPGCVKWRHECSVGKYVSGDPRVCVACRNLLQAPPLRPPPVCCAGQPETDVCSRTSTWTVNRQSDCSDAW